MDNTQMPPVQPVTPIQPGGMTSVGFGPNGAPMVQQVQLPPEPKKSHKELIKTIVIIVLALVSATFIGLFIWMLIEKTTLQENWDEMTGLAVAKAVDEEAMQQANKCAEDKKYPYETFTGPADYGQLTLQYPKTWSVYVEKAATQGGDFAAYFNPVQVDKVGTKTINALRVMIEEKSFDEVVQGYQKQVEGKKAKMTLSTIEIGDSSKGVRTTANRYDGVIPGTELRGSIVVFKIRDKTVILETDSELFVPEFNKLLDTIVFNA